MQLIHDGDTVATGWLSASALPKGVAVAQKSASSPHSTNDLTLVYAGQGDGKTRELNHFGLGLLAETRDRQPLGLVPAVQSSRSTT